MDLRRSRGRRGDHRAGDVARECAPSSRRVLRRAPCCSVASVSKRLEEGTASVVKLITKRKDFPVPETCDNPHDRPVIDRALGADKDERRPASKVRCSARRAVVAVTVGAAAGPSEGGAAAEPPRPAASARDRRRRPPGSSAARRCSSAATMASPAARRSCRARRAASPSGEAAAIALRRERRRALRRPRRRARASCGCSRSTRRHLRSLSDDDGNRRADARLPSAAALGAVAR